MLFPVSFFLFFFLFARQNYRYGKPEFAQHLASVSHSIDKEGDGTHVLQRNHDKLRHIMSFEIKSRFDLLMRFIFQSAETNSVAAFYKKTTSGRPSAATRESDCTPGTATS